MESPLARAELKLQKESYTATKCAWVTEWLPDICSLRALSFWVGDGYFGDYEYHITHTPCEPVINERQLFHVPDRVIELYPQDPDLKPLGAVSYLGVPLLDTDERILGHLAVLHTEPLPEDPRVIAIFNIFAGRAAAELRRLRRDRDLREREQKLSRLIGSTMDAIVELDGDLALTGMNSAAANTFGCAAEDVIGKSLKQIVTRESYEKLTHLTAPLKGQPEGKQSLWIPDGIQAVRVGGETFPAEATVSRFELSGQTFFTLILRDIDERIEAEAQIRSLLNETDYLRSELEELHGFDNIVGNSEPLRRVLADVEKVAGGDTTVLITGETGTGKELVARAIHKRSPRAEKPLIRVNCAAIAPNLQESEFFGHEKGAFTGATQRREGRFKLAHGGTIFLDEIGEMPLDLQTTLLRVLQEGEFEPVGSSRTESIDVRVITATNRNLKDMVDNGTFRGDLLYRLNVFPIHMPPLRERGEDVVLLAQVFAQAFASQRGQDVPALTPGARARLQRYDWPGNIRELQNVIERAFITSKDGWTLNFDRAFPEDATGVAIGGNHPVAETEDDERVFTVTELQELEKSNLRRALESAGGKISGPGGAAEMLGLNPNTLTSRIKTLGIRRPRNR